MDHACMGRLPCDPGVTTALLGRRFRGCNHRDTFVQQTDPPMYRVLALCSAVLFTVLQGSAQCLIGNSNAPGSDPTDVEIGQSFMPTCNGVVEYVELYCNEGGTNVAGELRIYAGSTVTSTPVYTQAVPATAVAAGSYLRVDLTTPVPAVAFQSLTFELPMSLEIPFSGGNPYPSGRMFYNGTNSGLYANSDLRFNVSIASDCTPTSAAFAATACGSYLSPSGQQWTTSGVYVDTITNLAGCDSVVTIALTVIDLDTTLTVDGLQLTANATGVDYQWIDCNSGLPVDGADQQSYLPANAGNYAVELSVAGCTAQSACVFVGSTAVPDPQQRRPLAWIAADGSLMVRDVAAATPVHLLDAQGRCVFTTTSPGPYTRLPLPALPTGCYLLQLPGHGTERVMVW